MDTHNDPNIADPVTEFCTRFTVWLFQQRIRDEALHVTRSHLFGLIERRFGAASDGMRGAIDGCHNIERLTSLLYEIVAAPDRETAERLTLELEPQPGAPGAQ